MTTIPCGSAKKLKRKNGLHSGLNALTVANTFRTMAIFTITAIVFAGIVWIHIGCMWRITQNESFGVVCWHTQHRQGV